MKLSRFRIKNIATQNDEVLYDSLDPDTEIKYVEISDVRFNEGIINKTDYTFAKAPSRARRKVHNGDIIISTVRTYLKAVASIVNPEDNLIVSTGFSVIRPKIKLLDSNFAGFLFLSEKILSEIVSRSVGVSYPAVRPEDIANIEVMLPPLPVQRAIAAYLDCETARIDALIALKKRQIELLREKRQAVITRAVTKGLNPAFGQKGSNESGSDRNGDRGTAQGWNGQMKNGIVSGYKWYDFLPDDWRERKIQYSAKVFSGGTPDRNNFDYWEDGTVPWLTSGEINKSTIYSADNMITELALKESSAKWAKKGNVLIALNGQGKTKGTVAILETDSTINQSLGCIQLDTSHFYRYVFYYLFSKYWQIRGLVGEDREGLNLSLIKAIVLPLPPLPVQRAIAAYLDHETARIDALITKIEHSISLLHEYRSSLITAAVSGQIDVGKTLPEVEDEEL